jgi:drug/metabolite transporter (DMT)-like permease
MLPFALWHVSRLHCSGKGASSTSTKRSLLTSVGVSLVILVGVLETVGLLLNSLDTQLASTSLASVLSSSWGIIPQLAGIVFFRERPLPLQMFGIVLVVGGLLLLVLKPT